MQILKMAFIPLFLFNICYAIGASNGRSYDTQTLLTSLTGNNVNLHVNNNTSLTGAVIAATDTQGNDTGNLNLTTNTLTTQNLTDIHYNSNTGFSVGANVGLTPTAKDPKPDDTSSKTKINSEHMTFNTSTTASADKTLATVGSGNITIADTTKNRDITQTTKTLYNSSTGTKVDATLDTRLLSVDGRAQIKQEYKDMDKNMKAVSQTLPSAISTNPIEAGAGKLWDNIAAYATLGILPSNGNNGGMLGEIPILFGNKDSVKEVLQVVSDNSPLYNKDPVSFIPIELSDAYQMMLAKQQDNVEGLYISAEPVAITKANATYQNGGNGIMNDVGLAVSNVLEQTGQSNKSATVETTVFYNPSRGMVADSAETLVDLFGGTTGIAKQEGEFVRDVTTARATDGANFTQHSQDNALLYSGINYINSTDNMGAKFQGQDYFIKDNGDKSGIPTFVSFGSPVNGEDLKTLIVGDIDNPGLGYTYMGVFTNEHDYVGQGLGRNDGVNGQASNWQILNLIDIGRLLMPSSPHSGYNPYNFTELQNVVGYKK
jgi:filamentous hemagglutinin